MYNNSNGGRVSNAGGTNNPPNAPVPQQSQGFIQNTQVVVTTGPATALAPPVQQFATTQTSTLQNPNWSNASLSTAQTTAPTNIHPHIAAAEQVSTFLGRAVPLDMFSRHIAGREFASLMSRPYRANQMVPADPIEQQVLDTMTQRVNSRSLSLSEIRTSIEDSYPGLAPQPRTFMQDAPQPQVFNQLSNLFLSNSAIDSVLYEVQVPDGSGQTTSAISGLYREGGKWWPTENVPPLYGTSDGSNIDTDGSIKSPAVFLGLRHNASGNPQQAGLSILTLTPQQRQTRAGTGVQQSTSTSSQPTAGGSPAPDHRAFPQTASQLQVLQELSNLFATNPNVDRVLYKSLRADPNGRPIYADAGLYRERGKWWRMGNTPTPTAGEGNNIDSDGSVKNPALFLALRHAHFSGGNPQVQGLSLIALTPEHRSTTQQQQQSGSAQALGMVSQSTRPTTPFPPIALHQLSNTAQGSGSQPSMEFRSMGALSAASFRQLNLPPDPESARSSERFKQMMITAFKAQNPTIPDSLLKEHMDPVWLSSAINFDYWCSRNPLQHPSRPQTFVRSPKELARLPDREWNNMANAFCRQQANPANHAQVLALFHHYMRTGTLG